MTYIQLPAISTVNSWLIINRCCLTPEAGESAEGKKTNHACSALGLGATCSPS